MAHLGPGFLQPILLTFEAVSDSFTILSIALNVFLTTLIAFRLTSQQRRLQSVLPGDLKVYSNAVAIVAESALPLTVFALGFAGSEVARYVVGGRAPDGSDAPPEEVVKWLREYVKVMELNRVFSLLYYSMAALTPQIIIFRITVGRSWMGRDDHDASKPLHFSQPLRFDNGQRTNHVRGTDILDEA
ncbi:hypothetical protein CC1G_05785 [Coprinopsis cinerea okayama7|uniref:Uncharacterized protein n=1 Tax=Coprinopsis cinerea (strain Okayama-7 / 130 / ATCC MYA-4618 / FGSC 9003) TaxID=240176 RepID=A8NLB9_COPC7|nr:hypothetical protein CC1G_05785 [Coprinopsis cinerea okayama7\|eukprot:XP_001834648.2 hypothetical protein CC1G_05785 [Coprinopsis cinerea okayama7\